MKNFIVIAVIFINSLLSLSAQNIDGTYVNASGASITVSEFSGGVNVINNGNVYSFAFFSSANGVKGFMNTLLGMNIVANGLEVWIGDGINTEVYKKSNNSSTQVQPYVQPYIQPNQPSQRQEVTCTACNGTGYQRYSYIEPPSYGQTRSQEYCSICGKIVNVHTHRLCTLCGGRGVK